MKRFYLAAALLTAATSGLWAADISEHQAMSIAQDFFNDGKRQVKGTGIDTTIKLAHASKGYYAFTRGDNLGYVIVAADDIIANPVLGYADQGTFEHNQMPDNMRWWLSEYERELESLDGTTLTNRVNSSATNRTTITPLLATKWGQDAPYNNMCPIYNGTKLSSYAGKKCPTGCVATALAQVMFHHRWPKTGTGSASYEWIVNEESLGTLSSDFSQHSYNYDAMRLDYSTSSFSENSATAVSQFLYDIGIAVNMAYAPTGSGAYDHNAVNALINHFDYDESLILAKRDHYSRSEWIDMIYSNLENNQPLYYSGSNASSGHAFVIDGYKDGYFHLNWGWDGMSNGYFLLSVLDPAAQGTGGSSAGYNYNQSAILNLKPDVAGENYSIIFYSNADFSVTEQNMSNDLSMTRNSTATFSGGAYNGSLCTVTASLGVKVVSANGGNPVYLPYTYSDYTLEPNYGLQSYNVKLSNFPSENGSYYVTPAYRIAEGAWNDVLVPSSHRDRIIATVSGDNIEFSYPDDYFTSSINWDISVEGKCFAQKSKRISINMFNDGDKEFFSNFLVHIVSSGTTSTATSSNVITADMLAGEGQTFDVKFTMPSAAGEYDIVLTDEDGYILGNRYTITVETAPAGNGTIVCETVTMDNPNNVAADAIKAYATFSCTKGCYDGYIGSILYDETFSTQLGFNYGGFTISEGENVTRLLAGDYSSTVEVGKTYNICPIFYNTSSGYLEPFLNSNGSIMGIKFTVSSTTGIETIETDNNGNEATEIYTISGIKVQSDESGDIDMTSLAPGIYIIKNGNSVKRFIKR